MKTIEELEAELETVTRQRDEARADLSDALARIAAIAQALGCDAQALAEDPSVARAEVERLRERIVLLEWNNEAGCENTPTRGCECPGCMTARERATGER